MEFVLNGVHYSLEADEVRSVVRGGVLPLPVEVVFAAEERLLELTDPPLNLQGVPTTLLRRTLSRLRLEVSAEG